MELFPATNESQMEFIRKLIDESDFYVIILAGKYGTIPEGKEISYTKMEYEYGLRGWTRSEIDILRLTGLFNNFQGNIITTLPVYAQSERMNMVQINEIKGLMNLTNLLGKVNINLDLLNANEMISSQNYNEVCIGGTLSNEASNTYM